MLDMVDNFLDKLIAYQDTLSGKALLPEVWLFSQVVLADKIYQARANRAFCKERSNEKLGSPRIKKKFFLYNWVNLCYDNQAGYGWQGPRPSLGIHLPLTWPTGKFMKRWKTQ